MRRVCTAIASYVVFSSAVTLAYGAITGFPMQIILEGDAWFIPFCGVLGGCLLVPLFRSGWAGSIWKQATIFAVVATAMLCVVWLILLMNFEGI